MSPRRSRQQAVGVKETGASADLLCMGSTRLATANDLLLKAFQLSSDAFAVTRVDDGRLIEVNDAFLRLFGYERDQVIGRTTIEIGLWADTSDRRRLLEVLARDGATGNERIGLRTGTGEVRTVEISAHVVHVDGVPCILAIDRDVTDRDRQEVALRQSEERFRALATFAPVGIYLTDPNGDNVFMNNRLIELTGRDATKGLGRGWIESIHPDDLTDVYNRWYTCARDGEPFAMEFRYLRPDGSVLHVHSSAIPLTTDDGTVTGYLGTVVDMTQYALAEETLRAAFDREREVAKELRTLDQMKNTLLEAVSHDIRTPLTTVLGIALTLQREDLALSEQETRDLLRRLAASAQKLERLVADLLDLDRIRRGLTTADRRRTDVGQLVERVVHESDLPVDREVTVHTQAVVAEVDGPKVERIVANLVANGLRHTPPGTPLWVRVEPADDGVLIAVEDAGPGVPEDVRTAIFEPFRHGTAGPKGPPGVGIGLALVARFASLHGGRAWVQEREGGGSSFRVLLPAEEQPTGAVARIAQDLPLLADASHAERDRRAAS
jgi:PAS domain S-box-containing protein